MFSHIIRVRGIFDDEPTTKKLYFHMSRREMFDFIRPLSTTRTCTP